jgi:dimethylamine/trimethylamine dehydrogenase
VAREARLPGLAAWQRVVDYREAQLRNLASVDHYFESEVTAEEVLGYDFSHVVVATGSTWRGDGVGRWHTHPVPIHSDMELLTPDDLMTGARPRGRRVVVYDDDHYYMGGVLAELLRTEGYEVVVVTPAATASAWTANTLEQARIQRRLLELGVEVVLSTAVTGAGPDGVALVDAYTDRESSLPAEALVVVTARLPNDRLATDLEERQDECAQAGLLSVRAVGDAYAPGTIAAAVWEGHRYAEELDTDLDLDATPFRREVTGLSIEP